MFSGVHHIKRAHSHCDCIWQIDGYNLATQGQDGQEEGKVCLYSFTCPVFSFYYSVAGTSYSSTGCLLLWWHLHSSSTEKLQKYRKAIFIHLLGFRYFQKLYFSGQISCSSLALKFSPLILPGRLIQTSLYMITWLRRCSTPSWWSWCSWSLSWWWPSATPSLY